MYDSIDEEAQQGTHRHIFAERHQLNLVVVVDHLACARDQVGAVVSADLAVSRDPDRRRAEQDRIAGIDRELEQTVAIDSIASEAWWINRRRLKEKRRRRLRPYHQVNVLVCGLLSLVNVDVEAGIEKRRVPLDALRDVALDHRDPDFPGWRLRSQRVYSDRPEDQRRQHQSRQGAKAPGLNAARMTPEQHDENHRVEENDQSRNAVYAGYLGELNQFEVAIGGITEQVPWKPDRKKAAQPLDRRPRDRQGDEDRQAEAHGRKLRRPNRKSRKQRHNRGQQHQRARGQDGVDAGKVVQRVFDPVKRYDVAHQPLEEGVAEHPAQALALDRLEQRNECDPRKEVDVKLGKGHTQRDPADDA